MSAMDNEKRRPPALKITPSRSSSSGSTSTASSLGKSGVRTARFAEATQVHSPIEQTKGPFSDDRSVHVQAQPADVGFGYINDPSNRESVNMPMTPRSPLKSALKVPGTPGRKFDNPLSPTFREEEILEKREKDTDKEQSRDLVGLLNLPLLQTPGGD
jgi:hypothetical protein